MTDLTRWAAIEQAGQLRSRRISAVECLMAHLARIEAVNPGINAFITLDEERALARASELDRMAARGQFAGPLHGVPVAVKDIFETRGLRTTRGSKSYESCVPDYDALHVARLRAAGAVIVGKTNTPEFAFSGQTSNLVAGTTRNPLNPGKTVAGSSGGAAAALAAHMVALANGSDLGGSTRTPAAWCGIVGFRPTSGLIPYHPNPAPFDGLSVPGPMARNVADLVLMLSVMQGHSAKQPLSYGYELPSAAQPDTMSPPGRIAFSAEPFGAVVDPSVQTAVSTVRPLLQDLGWEVEEAEPDLIPLLDYSGLTRGQCALQIRAALEPDMALVGDSFRAACAPAEHLTLADLIAYQAVRAKVWQDVSVFFERYDFAVWPTATGLPYSADLKDHELPEDWRTVTLTPVLELPSVSVHCGTSSDGMPVGLHITGPRGSDARLLRFARLAEAVIGGCRP